MKVAIDPGHGGIDPGTSAFGIKEKDITLPVAMMTAEALVGLGHDVVLTRQLDRYVRLNKRAEQANVAKADRFLSIHVNAAAHRDAHGIETWFYTDSQPGRCLAAQVQAAMMQEFLESASRGLKSGSFAVLRLTRMPAALVELGFITNTRERRSMRTEAWQRRAALALARGVSDLGCP